jgi:hypothetical protein
VTLKLAAPWYLHPALSPRCWESMLAGELRLDFAVVNIADGPGTGDDADYVRWMARRTLISPRLVGYVDLDYGRRSGGAVERDIRLWMGKFSVAGLMFDRVPVRPKATLDRLATAVQWARSRGADFVVANPGTMPPAPMFEWFDVVCVSERGWTSGWSVDVGSHAESKQRWHLLHSCPPAQVPRVVDAAIQAGGSGYLWVSQGRLPNPWSSVSRRFLDLIHEGRL